LDRSAEDSMRPSSGVRLFCRDGANQQHWYRALAHDLFRITSHEQARNAAAAVGAAQDQLRWPVFRMLRDESAGPTTPGLDQQSVHLDRLFPDPLERRGQELLTVVALVLYDAPQVDPDQVRRDPRPLIHDVHEADSAAERLRERDRLFEATTGRIAAIDRNQDVGVHAALRVRITLSVGRP